MSREVHDKFVEIKIHTAKCDNCNKHNTAIIFRCQTCGQQCCTPCWQRNGGDDRHKLNGGDQGFTVAGEVLGRRKRESARMNASRRVRRRMTVTDDDGDDANDEDDNGEGCAEVIATSENKAQIENPGETAKESRHRFMKATQTEPTAASSKRIPEKELSPSIFTAVDRLLSCAVPSRNHVPAVSRLRPYHNTHAVAAPHQASTPATANAHFSSYISPYPPSASDHDGIMALLRAADYIESDKLPSPSPPRATQRFSAPRDDENEEEDEGWGQDAQARSPLFTPEDIDLKTQSEDVMLQLDGAQDKAAGMDSDKDRTPTGRVSNRILSMDDGSDEETEYEDWRRIDGGETGPSRAAAETRITGGLDRHLQRATQRD